ncbi:MAG: beta-L-arabinofuranosidase domain-containing protein [Bacteroidota bacterium]
MRYLLLIICVIIMCNCTNKENSQGENFLDKVNQNAAVQAVDPSTLDFFKQEKNTKDTPFKLLPFGEIRPKGWMLEMMEFDITDGIVGNLDRLAPDVLIEDDLYNTERRMHKDDIPAIKNMVLTGEAWEQSIQWWNSESKGNWLDGFVRGALLSNNEAAITKSNKIVAYILSAQDKDGYIGIYGPELRYKHEASNGELWSQATLFRMLIGYYEFTSDQKVLDAIEKAMALTMKEYGPEGNSPFNVANSFGGVTHGLMLTDVCEMLHRITGKQAYADYAVFLYEDFSRYPLNRAFNDVRYEYLIEEGLFESHSVHTYEHLRTLIYAYYQTDFPELATAFTNAEKKLETCILPSGGGFGDEWIAGRHADPDSTAAEFCSQFELREYFGSALQKSGKSKYGDQYEKITFNNIMGKRSPSGDGITYCKTDNSYELHAKSPSHGDDLRFKYSPVHADVAICCAPNYGKHLPYYVGQMWMKADDGLAAVLYGPNRLETQISGVTVSINSSTNYPFSDEIKMSISVAEPIKFSIYLRQPEWSAPINLEGAQGELENGFVKITKEWTGAQEVTIRFKYEAELKDFSNHKYVQRGPLVYALPIEYKTEALRTYNFGGFSDYFAIATEEGYDKLEFTNDQTFKFNSSTTNSNSPWNQADDYIEVNMKDTESGEVKVKKLIPFGNTVLRRVTFPATE